MHPRTAYVAFGSNLGNRFQNIDRTLKILRKEPGLLLRAVSPIYETQPVGGPPQRDFLNGVLQFETSLTPLELLGRLKAAEIRVGRRRSVRWGPRVIDLDLLAVGSLVMRRRGLILPHPSYHLRRFVMVPFADLAPDFRHPLLRRKNSTLLAELTPRNQRVTILKTWKKKRFSQSRKKRMSASPSSL